MADNEKDADIQMDSSHTSAMLTKLIDEAPSEHFTLAWLVSNLPKRSFGVIMLFLALIAMLPIISIPSNILMLILTFQVIAGYRGPVLPEKLMMRPLPSRYLVKLEKYAIPVLTHIEHVVRPRWPRFLKAVRRITAFIAMILVFMALINPIPLSNIPPAVICALMALAYIEQDGLLLIFALACALTLLTGVFWVVF